MSAEVNGRLWGARARDWAEVQENVCRPVYEDVLRRAAVGPGTNYLDIGCGAGLAARLAAARGAKDSGLDAAENLLAIAKSRVPSGDFRLGDMEVLPFPDRSFDLVSGFNSFQYAANPAAALAEARRVAKLGGTVVIMTWGEPDGMQAASLVGALKGLVPAPQPGTPGPFALSDDVVLRNFASKAGLELMGAVDVDSPWYYPDLSTALRGLMSSGAAIRAAQLSSEEAVRKAYTDALAAFRQSDGSYRMGATFRCLFASV